MPTETIAVLAFVGLIFALFAVGVVYADVQPRKFRD